MPWLKTDTLLRKHYKLNVTAGDLDLKPVYLRGHLVTLWLGALEAREDGDLSGLDNAMIADLAEWKISDADRFVRALTERRWIENGLIHDWLDYVGDYLIKKYKTRKREYLVEVWAKHGRVYGDGKQEGSTKEAKGKQEGSNREAKEVDKDKETTKPLLPRSKLCELAERLVALYGELVKPKRDDNSGSKKVFVSTAVRLLSEGCEFVDLEQSIRNYADVRTEQESRERDPDAARQFRWGFQTFFGPKNEHWKDFINVQTENTAPSAEEVNAAMEECERLVADVPDWTPAAMMERELDGSG